ncbi:hypothetical protein AB0L41_44980 [Amycolatopsis mediterranei]|uniref:hypothetical protein n=1 Tax=Amycolatopsis mediterranei TaxID=33910 RepID=UPI0034121F9E
MANWISDYLGHGLHLSVASLQLAVVRVALALALLWKFAFEHAQGAWHWFDRGSYVRHEYEAAKGRLLPVLGATGYRLAYVVKAAAVVLLLAGVSPRTAAVVLGAFLLFQLTFENTHTNLFLVACAVVVALGDGPGQCLTWRTVAGATRDGLATTLAHETAARSDAFPAVLGAVVVAGMYVNTAVQKLRSPDFRSGVVIHRWLEHMAAVRPTAFRLVWYPKWVVRRFVTPGAEVGARRLRLPAQAAIAAELLLPAGLLWWPSWPLAVVAGIGMHTAFALLSPVRLVPFSLAVVSTYALFIPG